MTRKSGLVARPDTSRLARALGPLVQEINAGPPAHLADDHRQLAYRVTGSRLQQLERPCFRRSGAGLRVDAHLVHADYPTGVKISNKEMKDLSVRYHDTQPSRNYTISPG